MAKSYKGKYILQSNGNYDVELYEDNTLKDTIKDIDEVGVAKAMILTWYSEKGYTDLNVTNENFTPDMENFDSLYVKT